MMDKPKTGTAGAPTLSKKGVSDFTVTPDVQRIMGTKADPEGFNPEVNVSIPDPAARSYAARISERAAKRAASSLKGKSPPFGHVEPPPSEKMEAIAGLSGLARPSFGEPPAPPPPQEEAMPPPSIPEPKAIPGVGAAYPVNQALSQGKTDGPVTLREGNNMTQTFSKETVQALEMANQNIQKKAEERIEEKAPEPKAQPSVAKKTKEELDSAEQDLSPVAATDFAAIGDLRTTLMSQKRRDDIESRLKPLDIGDMIMKREITQNIPIIPSKLEVTLRTFSQRENLWVLKYIYDFPGSALYLQELLNTCRLVCGLVAVNGAYLPDHRKDVGQATEAIIREDFEKKFFHVTSFPVQLVADLSVQSIWFQDRVDKLFTVEVLKNG